jgi:hypothetical protein
VKWAVQATSWLYPRGSLILGSGWPARPGKLTGAVCSGPLRGRPPDCWKPYVQETRPLASTLSPKQGDSCLYWRS